MNAILAERWQVQAYTRHTQRPGYRDSDICTGCDQQQQSLSNFWHGIILSFQVRLLDQKFRDAVRKSTRSVLGSGQALHYTVGSDSLCVG
jgi:hypothetical protein